MGGLGRLVGWIRGSSIEERLVVNTRDLTVEHNTVRPSEPVIHSCGLHGSRVAIRPPTADGSFKDEAGSILCPANR